MVLADFLAGIIATCSHYCAGNRRGSIVPLLIASAPRVRDQCSHVRRLIACLRSVCAISCIVSVSTFSIQAAMASRGPVADGGDDADVEFWAVFAAHQAALQRLRMQRLALSAEIDMLEAKSRRHRRRSKRLLLAAVLQCTRQRALWMYPRPNSWYETTLPHLPDSGFRDNFRMNRPTFHYIVGVCENMRRQDTSMRKAIALEKRVAIGLYRLATSAEERTVANLFGVSPASVNMIFREFCAVIVNNLEAQLVCFPKLHELQEHMRQFAAVCGFPQGVGALDGCHIEVCPPKEEAADYFNYKGWYSIILLAVVDHKYKFLYTNSGSPGKNNDSAVFQTSRLPRILDSDLFQLETRTIQGVQVGPVLLADQAFALQRNVMKPYSFSGTAGSPAQTFNYHLSSARRVVENAFGRVKARFRMLLKGLECSIHNVNIVVRAACVLHNVCEQFSDGCDAGWLSAVQSANERRPQPVYTSSRLEPSGVAIRNALANHLAGN